MNEYIIGIIVVMVFVKITNTSIIFGKDSREWEMYKSLKPNDYLYE